MAKKIRRRRTTNKKKVEEKPELPTLSVEEIEEDNEKVKSVLPKIYQDTNFDRLNSLPDFNKVLKPNRVSSLIANLGTKDGNQFVNAAKDPKSSMLEKIILLTIKEAADENNPKRYEARKMIMDRIDPPKKEIEFTGSVENKVSYKDKPDLAKMTREEKLAYKEQLRQLKSLPIKTVEITDGIEE